MKYRFYRTCVDWCAGDVHVPGGLIEMIVSEKRITRASFLRNVDRDSLRRIESSLGYRSHPHDGLTMAGDRHVTYHRSKLHGKRVYYFRHSAIEYVFVSPSLPSIIEIKSEMRKRCAR